MDSHELAFFLLSAVAVAGLALAVLLHRYGLRLWRRVRCWGGACAGGRGEGKRWQGLALEEDFDDDLEAGAEAEAVDGVVRVQLALDTKTELVEEGPEEIELELAGLRNVADVKATIASMYAVPGAELELATLLVVQCFDEERGLTVSLPSRTPIAQLLGVEQLVVAQRGSSADGAPDDERRSQVGSTVAARKAQLLGQARAHTGLRPPCRTRPAQPSFARRISPLICAPSSQCRAAA